MTARAAGSCWSATFEEELRDQVSGGAQTTMQATVTYIIFVVGHAGQKTRRHATIERWVSSARWKSS